MKHAARVTVALDRAFEARVARLFDVLCSEDASEVALARFGIGISRLVAIYERAVAAAQNGNGGED